MKECIAFTTVPATVLIFVTMKKLNIRWHDAEHGLRVSGVIGENSTNR
jgi:hypothetical protein